MDHYDVTNDTAIEIERSEEFKANAKRLSDMITLLPIDHELNNRLVYGLFSQIQMAERDAFLQGFDLGVKCGRHFDEGGGEQ